MVLPSHLLLLASVANRESVEVNQRALIDKVLARYSGEFTGERSWDRSFFNLILLTSVFRELLQNSDDARSSAVEIRFETAAYLRRKDSEQGNLDVPPLPNLKSTHVRVLSAFIHSCVDISFLEVAQWTFRNNGIAFRDEDWTRLRKIGE